MLGVDGLDPKLLAAPIMDQDKLPNFKSSDRGRRVQAAADEHAARSARWPGRPSSRAWIPAATACSTSSTATPDTLMPTRAESGVKPPKTTLSLGGCKVLPLPAAAARKTCGKGRAFWQILDDHDVPTTVFRIPANFPAGRDRSGAGASPAWARRTSAGRRARSRSTPTA